MRIFDAVALLLAAGCGGCAIGDTTPLAGQDQAVALIWNQAYGETRDPPPIYWRRDRCNEPNGDYPPLPTCSFDNLNGTSVSGLQRDTPWHVEIGAPWGEGKISDTALAHELLHASIGDSEHRSEKWTSCPGTQQSAEARARFCAVLGGCKEVAEASPSVLCQAQRSLVAAGL